MMKYALKEIQTDSKVPFFLKEKLALETCKTFLYKLMEDCNFVRGNNGM